MSTSTPSPAEQTGAGTEFATTGAYVKGTEFKRDTNYINTRVTRDAADGFGVEAGRYRLIVSRACPWASRLVISRRVLGLEGAISMGVAGPTHDVRSWTFDLDEGGVDPVLGIHRLQDAYFARDPEYPKGITVPALVDEATGAVVTNDFDPLGRDFIDEWAEFHRPDAPDLFPAELRAEAEPIMRRIYTEINNGVYRSGFAGDQASYEAAFDRLFTALDWVEELLGERRFLLGDVITEADIRLFTTLVRFDVVYHGHFKANRNKLIEFPNLWNYAKDLFQTPGFGDTVDFDSIKKHYYVVHTDINPTQIVAAGPPLTQWLEPHDRDRFGGRIWAGGAAPAPLPNDEIPAANPLRR